MPKMTRDYQEGFCNICKKEALVRVLVNSKRSVCVCKNCINEVGDMTINELLKKYGESIDSQAS